MMQSEMVFSVSDFVAYLNQTLEMVYPFVDIVGEVSNFRVSKGKWVYFDLKDEAAMVRCFTTVYTLSGPLEDGMVVRVGGSPRLHPQYNFSITVQSVRPVGEGALKRQADLLQAKLTAEGLFDADRKRQLPYAPRHVALITAAQSAAYADFVKITKTRWGGVVVDVYDVQVQGEPAAGQIIAALEAVARQAELADVVVVVRGGGSAEDLAAFNDERVVRAVAASRVPTLVAIGHEVDISLAELAADVRASTPSNAAELLFPDKRTEADQLLTRRQILATNLNTFIVQKRHSVVLAKKQLSERLGQVFEQATRRLASYNQLIEAYDPRRPLLQGYAIVRSSRGVIRRAQDAHATDMIDVELADGVISSEVKSVRKKKE